MTFKPAHKEDDPSKLPGQIRNEITLGDYIKQKTSVEKRLEIQKKKMTFDDWWNDRKLQFDLTMKLKFFDCWDTAQENK
jgi:hypothetical protein